MLSPLFPVWTLTALGLMSHSLQPVQGCGRNEAGVGFEVDS